LVGVSLADTAVVGPPSCGGFVFFGSLGPEEGYLTSLRVVAEVKERESPGVVEEVAIYSTYVTYVSAGRGVAFSEAFSISYFFFFSTKTTNPTKTHWQ
jgi:hypothetical protein